MKKLFISIPLIYLVFCIPLSATATTMPSIPEDMEDHLYFSVVQIDSGSNGYRHFAYTGDMHNSYYDIHDRQSALHGIKWADYADPDYYSIFNRPQSKGHDDSMDVLLNGRGDDHDFLRTGNGHYNPWYAGHPGDYKNRDKNSHDWGDHKRPETGGPDHTCPPPVPEPSTLLLLLFGIGLGGLSTLRKRFKE
jgi:hypothetical protein